MSTFESDDLQTTGYFLPENSQLRLKKLREYVEFLSLIAQPRRPDEAQECLPEIRVGELAICLELLEEQIAQVLGELSWPAERGERIAAGEADADADAEACTEAAAPEASDPVRDEAGNRFLFGVTLDQLDEISRLLDSLPALGNVVTCSDHAELSDVTLSIMGDAIVRDVEKLRDINRDVNAQRLESPHSTKPGVREARAVYLAGRAHLPVDSASQEAGTAGIFRRFAPVAEWREGVSQLHRVRSFHENRDHSLAARGAGSA